MEECCICFNDKWQVNIPCKHPICLRCLFAISNKCPICRKEVFDKDFPDFLKALLDSNFEKIKTVEERFEDEFPPLGTR